MKKKIFTLLTLLVACVTGAWADEVIFSMTSVTNGKTSVAAGATQSITATFNAGSSAEVYNGHSKDAKEMISSGGQIQLGGSSASYFHAEFTTALAAGDVVSCTGDATSTFYLNGTSTKSSSSVTFPYTIKSTDTDLIGKTNLYVWKDGGKNFTAFAITRITGTHAPSITQDGSSVTITCATDGATIYYTIDGSEPTTLSEVYSSAISLDNTCTVRTFAKKGDDASGIAKRDCYVSHPAAIAVLGYNGGTVSGDVWASTDGNYTLTNNVADRGINYVDLAGTKDGFKLNHVDNYTIKPSTNVKITKIVVVGKTWLTGSAGNASTIAFDGFTPASGTFFDYPTDGETYLKTIEFTPTSELDFGDAVVMRPGNNQLGSYIEIYGEEKIKSKTFDYSTSAGKSNYANWTISPITVVTNATGVDGSNNYLKGSDLTATISAGDGYIVTKVVFTYTDAGRVSAPTTANDGTTVTTDGATQTWTNAGGKKSVGFTFASCRLTKIAVSYVPCVSAAIGEYEWATFVADKDLDFTNSEIKAYVVTGRDGITVNMNNDVKKIPANIPLLLNAPEGSYYIPVTDDPGVIVTNLLKPGTGDPINDGDDITRYVLGVEDGKATFLKIDAVPATVPVGKAYLEFAEDIAAPALSFGFNAETGINTVNGSELKVNGEYYNLAGQRVAQPTKGLYIVNGKKVIVK